MAPARVAPPRGWFIHVWPARALAGISLLSFVDAATGSVSRVLSAAADSFELGPVGEGSAATPSGSRSLEADPPPPAPPFPGWIDQDPALSEVFFYLLLAAGLVLLSFVFRRELGLQHPNRRRTRPQR